MTEKDSAQPPSFNEPPSHPITTYNFSESTHSFKSKSSMKQTNSGLNSKTDYSNQEYATYTYNEESIHKVSLFY